MSHSGRATFAKYQFACALIVFLVGVAGTTAMWGAGPALAFGAHISEGVQLTNASAMQGAGITGTGCKIAIIDLGFTGYTTAEIPTPAATPSFRADSSVTASGHGTAMAEVVADMAPDASLYLVSVDPIGNTDNSELSVLNAIDWVISQHLQVAVLALDNIRGPFDGTERVAQKVNQARQAGVFFVVGAGDYAMRHWSGSFNDSNTNSFSEWSGSNDNMPLTLPAGTFEAYLSWYQTAGPVTAQDYDLVLLDSSNHEIARSAVTQNGDDPPREKLTAVTPGGNYNLRLQAVSIDPLQVDTFQLFLPAVNIPSGILQIKTSSIASPAEAQYAYTVGATRGTAPVDQIEPYSSQGPGLGPTAKVDLVAPDHVTTGQTAPYDIFDGTSCAAAHVAGAAALLWSEDHTRTAKILEITLNKLALDLGASGWDPIYGNGRLNLRAGLDTDPPTVLITFPRDGTTIGTSQPRVTATLSDRSTAVDAATIVLRLDGVPHQLSDPLPNPLSYNALTGQLTFATPYVLTRTSHQITIDVSDVVGNVADTAISNFRVAFPTVDAGLGLFSLPYVNLSSPTPEALLGMPASDFGLVRWVPTDTTTTKYHFYPDPLASFLPPDCGPGGIVAQPPAGLGYFLNVPASTPLNITGEPLPSDSSYDIKLIYGTISPRGWNMIGTPFINATGWAGATFTNGATTRSLVDAVNAGVTDGILFELRNVAGSYFYDFADSPYTATMEPYKGYWLHVWRDTTLKLSGSILTSQTPQPAPSAPAVSDKNWRVQIVASAENRLDPTNFLGVSPSATDGFDPGLDVVEPPAVGNGLQVYFPQPDWSDRAGFYARDLRDPSEPVQSWAMEVACSLSEVPVQLRWPDLNSTVPAGVRLTLKDLDSGKEIYMRTATEYSFVSPAGGGVRHLQIVATTGGTGALAIGSVTAAGARGGGMAFSYQLTKPAAITVEIRNISGVLIKRFAEQMADANATQTVLWNGLSDRGTKVPAGRYLSRITARAEDGQAVQAIRPFILTP